MKDFGDDPESVSVSAHWLVCVVRLGLPLSFSRATGRSVTTDVSQGAKLRGETLLIASDCMSLTVTGSKDSHTKSLMASLKQTDHNYLVEILPGDWVLAWMVNDETTFLDLMDRVSKADPQDPCNQVDDGLKFVGRVSEVRSRGRLDRSSGVKSTDVTLTAQGFYELDTQFYYNQYLSEADTDNIGSWLVKVGVDLDSVFGASFKDGQKNNSRALISTLIDLIVGKGVKNNKVNQAEVTVRDLGHQDKGSLQQTAGAGTTDNGTEAPFAYLVPRVVGALLGLTAQDVSKNGGIMSYADIMATLMGVQKYSDNGNNDVDQAILTPALDQSSTDNRMYTGIELLGTYIPVMPTFTNKPLWSTLQQFLNPTVNEMYTCMRVNRAGRIMPTLVVRQIPFTTDAFSNALANQPPSPPYRDGTHLDVTRFLELPRWKVPSVIVNDFDIGRSDASRINFVQVYGQDVNQSSGATFPQQTAVNPPIRDDLDIQRSGLRPYITTVACAVKDTVGKAPTAWMALVADRSIGSQYTLNGTFNTLGIQAPICEGDNLEWENVVYHIESVMHHCQIEGSGTKSFTTTMTLTNGMRSDGTSDTQSKNGSNGGGSGGGNDNGNLPIYPGFLPDDNTKYNPGVSIDDNFDRTPPDIKGDLADPNSTPTAAVEDTSSTKNIG